MKVIITDSFRQDFEKTFKRYSFTIDNLIKKLKETKFIKLDKPYCKVKFNIKGISIRGIVFFNDIGNIFPILFVLKKDKTLGDNLVINKELGSRINQLLGRYSADFSNGKYLIF